MKKFIVFLISLYQKRPFQTGYGCIFYPSCSEYTKLAVARFGVLKGLYLGFRRILRCHPWNTPSVDPIPEKYDFYCKNKH
ncbi:MAG: membrane protein insertion efficiency factor YidD [Minisyncoccia bacterium]